MLLGSTWQKERKLKDDENFVWFDEQRSGFQCFSRFRPRFIDEEKEWEPWLAHWEEHSPFINVVWVRFRPRCRVWVAVGFPNQEASTDRFSLPLRSYTFDMIWFDFIWSARRPQQRVVRLPEIRHLSWGFNKVIMIKGVSREVVQGLRTTPTRGYPAAAAFSNKKY